MNWIIRIVATEKPIGYVVGCNLFVFLYTVVRFFNFYGFYAKEII